MPWILEHPCHSWLWDVPKILARTGRWRISLFLVQRAESERCSWLEMWTAEIGTVLLATVLERVDVAVLQGKTCSSKRFNTTLRFLLPHRFSFELAMVLTMNARRFQRTHP